MALLAFLALIFAFAGCAGGTRNPATTTAQQGSTTINLGDATNDQIIEFEVTVTAVAQDGRRKAFTAVARLDSNIEVNYYQSGGILPAVLNGLAKEAGAH